MQRNSKGGKMKKINKNTKMAKVISVLLTIILHVNGLSVPIKKPIAEWTSKRHITFLQMRVL